MIEYINIFDTKIEVMQKGDCGTPIVILSGMGCSFYEWHEVIEALSLHNRIILYHRPGLGRSELGSARRSTHATVQELNELLRVLNIHEPILLIGHSYGGLCAQHFTKQYPSQVSALALIDSTSHDLVQLDQLDVPTINEISSDENWKAECMAYAQRSEPELQDMINPILTAKQLTFPENVQEEMKAFQQRPGLYRTMLAEVESWYDDAANIKTMPRFSEIPLLVMGRDTEYMIELGKAEGLPEEELNLMEGTWRRLIEEQTFLSDDSHYLIAEHAGHSIHLDRPDLVIDSILELLKRAAH